jgi:uncharacterized Fe-S cluster protein YjdI
MKDITKKYDNGEITIVWKPSQCIHSTNCWNKTGLPNVFNPREKPWIKPENATTDELIQQIQKCPSGALSYLKNNEIKSSEPQIIEENIVETIPNGPLMVYGNIVVKNNEGEKTHKSKVTAFCRCGASQNKPYCDGSHTKTGFVG